MHDKPIVSVIVPMYRVEKYIDKCIRSIQAQSLDAIEILCVDDCGGDDSAAVAEVLSARDSRIKVIRHDTNKGLGGARNTGLDHARGLYVASVDGDDSIDADMLRVMVEAAREGDHDIVEVGYVEVTEHGGVIRDWPPVPGEFGSGHLPVDDIFKLLIPAFWSKLWRRTLLVSSGVRFPERTLFEDLATTPQLAFHAQRIRKLAVCPYRYLVRHGSIMNSWGPRHAFDYLRVFNVLKDFLIERGLYQDYLGRFRAMVAEHLHYHAELVLAERPESAAAEGRLEYVRTLSLLACAYPALDDELRRMDADALLARMHGRSPRA